MNISTLCPRLYRIDSDGAVKLGIRVGPTAGRAAARLSEQMGVGRIVDTTSGSIAVWEPDGFVAHEAALVLHGPWPEDAEPQSLREAALQPRLTALEAVTVCLRAAALLERANSMTYQTLLPEAWILLGRGRVLVLSDGVQAHMTANQQHDEALAFDAHLRHPGLTAVQSVRYGFDMLSFRIMTGQFPAEDNLSLPELNARQLNGILRTPRCLVAGVPDCVERHYSDLVHGTAQDFADSLQMIAEWGRSLPDQGHGPEHDPDEQALSAYWGRVKSYQRKQFFKRNRTLFMIAAAGLVLVGSLTASWIAKAFEPPLTAGMDATAVLMAFYGSFNSLDVELARDCVKPGASVPMLESLDNVFVVNQIRTGTERRQTRMAADAWLRAGKPGLPEGTLVFGIANLSYLPLMQDTEGAARRSYQVEYDFLMSRSDPSATPPGAYVERERHIDQVDLQRTSDGLWQITRLRGTSSGERERIFLPVADGFTGTNQ